jgi:zinc protease
MNTIKMPLILTILFFIFFTSCHTGGNFVKYDNGIKVISLPDKDSLVASVNVFVDTGSVDEKPSQAGISHFIEHLIFKGSKNYPGDLFSRNVENMGGYLNAATSKEYTIYYVDIQKDGVEETVKMLADAMKNPLFPQEEIDRERKVVIEEIQRHLDNPTSRLYEKFFEIMYSQSALKNSVIGTREVIAGVSRDEIYEYFSGHYVPENMTVIISGNFDEKKIKELVEGSFAKFEKKQSPPKPNLKEKPRQGKDITLKDNVEVSYMIGGFLGPDIDSQDIFAADLAMTVLGGGKSSRLNRSLKEEQLVYLISSSFYGSKGTGLFYIAAVFDAKNLEKVKSEIHKQIEKIIQEGISQEELNRAKAIIKTDWAFSHETPSAIAQNAGYWALAGRPEIAREYMSLISKVSAADIQNVLKKYYSKKNYSSAALIPK